MHLKDEMKTILNTHIVELSKDAFQVTIQKFRIKVDCVLNVFEILIPEMGVFV